jgi:enoyl-CoA hydratase/carnithine racemase
LLYFTLTDVSTDIPTRSGLSAGALTIEMRTGNRCVTLTKFPVAFCAGIRLNVFCDAGPIDSTRPWNVVPF